MPQVPSRSYWREVDTLDSKIRGLSQPFDKYQKLGMIGLRPRHTLWTTEQDMSFTYWNAIRIGYSGVSTMIKTDLVNVDPLTEGIACDNHEVRTGLLGKSYRYITGTLMLNPFRPLYIDYGHMPDIHNPSPRTSNPQSRRLDRQSGVIAPTTEDYETLLDELRRGATGEYIIQIPDKE